MSGEKTFIATLENQQTIIANQQTMKSNQETILAEIRGQRPKRYGFRIKDAEANPSTRVEYLYDAVGMTPAHMDFDTGAFNYGSWKELWFVRDNKPCMVKSDGTVDYWLNPNDYTKKAIDDTESDVANTAYDGNAMSAIPVVWVKRWTENGYRYFVACESQYDETYKAYAHTRPDGTVAPYAYHALFEGCKVDTKLRSLKGQPPMNSQNANAELTAAQANGDKWTITQWSIWNLLHDLLVLMGKSTNVQATYGQGHTTGGSSAADLLTTGTLSDRGQFFGYSGTTSAMKAFHIENLWGDRWERVVGCIYDHAVWKVKMTPEGGDFNFTGAGYTAVAAGIRKPGTDAAFGGWVSAAQQTEYGQFPTAIAGSETTYDCDFHYVNDEIVSVPIVGGNCNNGGGCGRYVNVNSVAGDAGWRVGASLSLKTPS